MEAPCHSHLSCLALWIYSIWMFLSCIPYKEPEAWMLKKKWHDAEKDRCLISSHRKGHWQVTRRESTPFFQMGRSTKTWWQEFSEQGSLSKSERELFMHNAWDSLSHWFSQLEVMGTYLPTRTLSWGGGLVLGWDPVFSERTSTVEISLPIFKCHTWEWDQAVPWRHSSHQSQRGSLYISLVTDYSSATFQAFWMMVVL